MVQLGLSRGIVALARNQAHRVLGGALRGGHRIAAWSPESRQRHCRGILDTLGPALGDVRGQVGLEIGPGDNLGVCALLVQGGCRRMYALEKFSHPTEIPDGVQLLHQRIEDLEAPEPLDFALSNDVFEHVDDVALAMQRVFAALRPGGLFVNSVDLRGHNMFKNPAAPLDHLTAPDWLYSLLTSHIETSNRVRCSELTAAATKTGFEVLRCEALARADRAYLHAVRPHLQSRFRSLDDGDLEVLQLLLVLRKPQ
ncbi:MAG: methyltransferase domain-containing protein [Planctomycetaceae bacterium]